MKRIFLLIALVFTFMQTSFAQIEPTIYPHVVGRQYEIGNFVSIGGDIYVATAQTTATPPTADWVKISDQTDLDAIEATTAIGKFDEGKGETYYPVGDDRVEKGWGGFRSLDLTTYDEFNTRTDSLGVMGSNSFSVGTNMSQRGFNSVSFGDNNTTTAATFSAFQFQSGLELSSTAYNTNQIGIFHTNTQNYTTMIGHSIDATSGGGNVMIGFGLAETTAQSDRVLILGEGNEEPINSLYFASNNIGTIIGAGVLGGSGAAKYTRTTPANALTVYRNRGGANAALAGAIGLPQSTLANIDIWRQNDWKQVASTVEYVDRQIDSLAGIDAFGFEITNNTTDLDSIGTQDGIRFLHTTSGPAADGNPWFQNVFLGESAGNFTTTGSASIGIGSWSLNALTTGTENIAVGGEALGLTTTGINNTAVGGAALYSNVDGIRNTGIGRQAGVWITTGSNNTFLGSTAGFAQVAGGNLTEISQAVLIGSFADGTQGSTNEIAIGYQVEGNGSNSVTLGNDGINNTYLKGTVHVDSLRTASGVTMGITKNTTDYWTGTIYRDGFPYIGTSRNNEAYPNLMVGLYAGGDWSTHNDGGSGSNDAVNTAVGVYAMSSLTTGNQNTAVGGGALGFMSDNQYNVAIGSSALFYLGWDQSGNVPTAGGNSNIGIGRSAGVNLEVGSNNIFIGKNAAWFQGVGGTLTNISQSIIIGADADGTEGANNEIAIGYNAKGKGSNTAMIGNEATIDSTFIAGELVVNVDPTQANRVGNRAYNDDRYMPQPSLVVINNGTDTRIPQANTNTYVKYTNAVSVTVTLNQDGSFDGGRLKQETYIQGDAGAITFAAGTGVTLLTVGTTPATTGAGATVTATWLSATEVLLVGTLD